jgi:hypothetical protein
VIVVDRLFIGGLQFVLDKIAQAVDRELADPARLKEELLAAQMRHELGEIDAGELQAIEAELLARLREISETEGPQGPISFGAEETAEVEISMGGDEDTR